MKDRFGPTGRANLFVMNFKHMKNKQTIQIKYEETYFIDYDSGIILLIP